VPTVPVVGLRPVGHEIMVNCVAEVAELVPSDGAPDRSGGGEGLPLPAPTDPGVTVSRHRALLTRRSVRVGPLPLDEQARLSFE
jgi:hypothetical protein